MELLRVFQSVWKQFLCLLLIMCGLCVFQIQNDGDRKISGYYREMLEAFQRIEKESPEASNAESGIQSETKLETAKTYQRIQEQIDKGIRKEKKEHPDRTEIEQAQTLFDAQVEYIAGYRERMEERIEYSKEVLGYSLFAEKNSFYRLNTVKTASDMEKVKDSAVALSNTMALEKLMNYKELPLLLLLALLLIAASFQTEANNGMQSIVKASKCGRVHLAIRRCIVLLLLILLLTFLANSAVFTVYLCAYGGFPDLANAVQSSQMFEMFPLQVSILQFFLLYCLLSAIGMYALGMLIYAVLLLIRSEKFSYMVWIGIFAAEYFLYYRIASNSTWCFLKYVNLFQIIFPGYAVRYENWGYEGFVTEVSGTAMTLTAVLFTVGTAAVILLYSLRYGSQNNRFIKMLQERITAFFQNILSKTNGFVMELYKGLILQRGWLILLVFLYLLSNCAIHRGTDYSKSNVYLEEFYRLYDGCVPSEEMGAYIEAQRQSAAAIEKAGGLTEIQKMEIADRKAAVRLMQENFRYISAVNSEKNIKAVIVNPVVYNDILGKRLYANQESVNLVCILTIILAVGGIFSFERRNKMVVLCRTCSNREKVWYHKLLLTVLIVFAVWGLSCLLNWMNICQLYRLNQQNAPLQSLAAYETFPFRISILGYLMLCQLARLFLLLGLGAFVFGISVFISYTGSIMASLGLLIPHLLYLFKVPFVSCLSAVISMDWNRCWREYQNSAGKYFLYFAVMLAGVVLCQRCFVRWNCSGRKRI